MSLLDDLRELGRLLPASHVPSDGEIKGVVGALSVLAEGGQDVFEKVKADTTKLHNFLATGDPEKTPVVVDPAMAAQAGFAQEQRIVELEQQVSNLLAALQQTKVGE